jgi:trimethylamine---corrinoid protein Co-methyltransferase
MQLQLHDISDQEFQIIHESVLRLLEEFGVLFEHRPAQELLAHAGNRTDDKGRVHLSAKFVEDRLAEVPKDGFVMYGRDESRTLRVAIGQMAFRPSTGAPFVLDYDTRGRREATLDDVRTVVTLTDALEGYDMVNPVVAPRDTPGAKGNMRLFAHAHRYSLKPSDLTVMTAEEVCAAGQIAAAIRGGKEQLRQKPLTAIDVAMITPLRCTKEQTEALLECAAWGIPIEVLTSPALGLTGPITLAGSVVVAMAEVIAAMCLVYLKRPGLGIINTARISPINMRTTAYNYGAPELGMGSVLMAAVSNRYYIPGNYYGLGTAAHFPGIQSSLEKTCSGLLMALGQPHMITGSGILDNAIVTSPEQLVIDNETIRYFKRIRKPIEITAETVGLDEYIAGMNGGGMMLAEEHTLKYLRQGELISAGLEQWASLTQWQERKCPDLFEVAHKTVERVLAEHVVPPFDNTLQTEIDRVIENMES